jgi:Tfp pilus assembly protein PilF
VSLIANLLKKVEPRKSSGAAFPPGLKRVVLESGRKNGTGRSRVTTIGLLAVGIASCGVAALFVMDYLQKPQPKTKRPPVAQVATTVPVAPAIPPAQAPTTTVAASVPAPVVTEKQPVATAAKPLQSAATTADAAKASPSPDKPAPRKSKFNKTIGKPGQEHLQAFVPPKQTPAATKPVENAAEEGKRLAVTRSDSPQKVAAAQRLSRDDLASRDAYLYTARSAEARGDYRQALEQYRKALAIDPNNHLLINNTAGVLIRMGANEEASGLLNRCLELKPGYASALVNKGIIAIKSGNTADGEAWLEKALAGEPGNRYALMTSGLLKEKAKDFKGAATTYRRLIETGDAQGYVGLGRVAESEGNRAEAVKIYRAALGREGLSAEIKRQLGERLALIER